MPKADEFIPDFRIIQEVVKTALLPVIQRCEETFGESLAADLVVIADGVEQRLGLVQIMQDLANRKPRGTIRLMFRRTFNQNRLRFYAESIYGGLAACKSGFSGFSVSGEVKLDGEQISVHTKGGVYRNNVWEWQGWQ